MAKVEAGGAMVAEPAHLFTLQGRSRDSSWDTFAAGKSS